MAPYINTRISSLQNLVSVNTAFQLRSIIEDAEAGSKVVACLGLNMVHLEDRTLLHSWFQTAMLFDCPLKRCKEQVIFTRIHKCCGHLQERVASATRHRPSITQLEMILPSRKGVLFKGCRVKATVQQHVRDDFGNAKACWSSSRW